jgi:hypothetical protein
MDDSALLDTLVQCKQHLERSITDCNLRGEAALTRLEQVERTLRRLCPHVWKTDTVENMAGLDSYLQQVTYCENCGLNA